MALVHCTPLTVPPLSSAGHILTPFSCNLEPAPLTAVSRVAAQRPVAATLPSVVTSARCALSTAQMCRVKLVLVPSPPPLLYIAPMFYFRHTHQGLHSMALEWNPVQATLLQRLDTVSSVDSGQVDTTHGISRNVSLTSGLTGGGPHSTAAYSPGVLLLCPLCPHSGRVSPCRPSPWSPWRGRASPPAAAGCGAPSWNLFWPV